MTINSYLTVTLQMNWKKEQSTAKHNMNQHNSPPPPSLDLKISYCGLLIPFYARIFFFNADLLKNMQISLKESSFGSGALGPDFANLCLHLPPNVWT